jgi:hypothetical protein
VALSGYGLMTSHVHLVATPPGETALVRDWLDEMRDTSNEVIAELIDDIENLF